MYTQIFCATEHSNGYGALQAAARSALQERQPDDQLDRREVSACIAAVDMVATISS